MTKLSIKAVQWINFLLPVGLFTTLSLIYILNINSELFYQINAIGIGQDTLWSHLTFFGDTLLVYQFLSLVVFIKPRMIGSTLITMVIGFIVIHALKRGFDLRRPAGIINPIDFNIIGKIAKRHAFPSGHSATAFAFAAVFTQHFRKNPIIWISAISLACLAALSRIVVGAHWPTDILAGSALGWLCGLAGYYLVKNKTWPNNPTFQKVIGILSVGAAIALFFHTGGYPLVETFAKTCAVISALIWLYFLYIQIKNKQ